MELPVIIIVLNNLMERGIIMAKIHLTKSEEELYQIVERCVKTLMEDIHGNSIEMDKREELYQEMAHAGHELHKSLAEGGNEPVHHKYMIKNRGMEADDPLFYDHIHPAQDLLAFINDPHANDDPVDQTLNNKFKIKIFSRRWGHKDSYTLTRTATGWDVSHLTYVGECNKSGQPTLLDSLKHDSINFPEDLGGYLEWVWERASEDGLTHDEVQEALDQLGEWISLCESSSPKGIFQGYK